MFAIATHLYRKSPRFAIALLIGIFSSCILPAHAQRPELKRPQDQQSAPSDSAPAKKSKRTARAIGVVEFLPSGGIRLVPVALWYEGKYYDASLYQANPAPLALEPGTVYQALNDGEPAGIFVVGLPKQSNAGWSGDGRWTPRRALDEQLAAEAAKHPKPTAKQSKAIFTSGADDGPPVLKRPGSDQSSAPASATQTTPPATTAPPPQPPAAAPAPASATGANNSTDPGRPTLRRPNDDSASSAPPPVLHPVGNQPQTTDDADPDRPVFHRPTSPPAANSGSKPQPGAKPSDENDPDRPVLTRSDQPAAPQPKPSVAGAATHAPAKTNPKRSTLSLAAISDAGKYETRPMVYATTPERQEELSQSLRELALADIRNYAAKHPSGPQVPKNAALTDYDLRFFDLDFSNSPVLVLTAKLPLPVTSSRPFAYYSTYVARLDVNGDPVKVFTSVTDTMHLDVFPRMELIDALDADANGRGDLLFRQYSDVGISYGLYRVFPYNMEKLFEGGASL